MTRYAIVPMQPSTWLFGIFFLIVMPTVAFGAIFFFTDIREKMSVPAATILTCVLCLDTILLLTLRRSYATIDQQDLIVKAGIYTLRVPLADLNPNGRVVNLVKDNKIQPKWRTNGIGLPGFQAGHFKLRDDSTAFLMVTSQDKVLVLEERSGRKILLSLEQPDSLVRALKR